MHLMHLTIEFLSATRAVFYRAFKLCILTSMFFNTAAMAQTYFDAYGLTPASAALDLGVQPLGYPNGVISAVMRRDKTLQAALVAVGHPLAVHPFKRGADMVGLLATHRLEAGLMGDMPTLMAASTGSVWIVGLVKQSATAIVARNGAQVRDLVGKRIGYVPLSSAHHTLLQGLTSAQLLENDATLVPMDVVDMPAALARGEIDAFAAWEPAPSLALAQSEKNRIVFRSMSSGYFVIDRVFERSAPHTARLLVAGYVRAMEWMRRTQVNRNAAAAWVLADGQAFSGKPAAGTIGQISEITRRDILSVPSAPVIDQPAAMLTLKTKFDFLSGMQTLPLNGQWPNVVEAFQYDGLRDVLSNVRQYELRTFNYEQ